LLSHIVVTKQLCITNRSVCNTADFLVRLAHADTILEADITATFNVALLHHWSGNGKRAIELYERCLALHRLQPEPDFDAMMHPLTNLEILYRSVVGNDSMPRLIDQVRAERWEIWMRLNWYHMSEHTGCAHQMQSWQCSDVSEALTLVDATVNRRDGLKAADVLPTVVDPPSSMKLGYIYYHHARAVEDSNSNNTATGGGGGGGGDQTPIVTIDRTTLLHGGRQALHIVLRDATVYPSHLGDVPPVVFTACRVWLCGQFLSYGMSSQLKLSANPTHSVERFQQLAVIASKHVANYYHFLIEGCSGLLVLLEHVVPKLRERGDLELGSFKILVGSRSQNNVPFSFQVLELLADVYPELILMLEWYDHRVEYRAERLHIVDWFDPDSNVAKVTAQAHAMAAETGEDVQVFAGEYNYFNPPASVLRRLSKVLQDGLHEAMPRQKDIVYSSRAQSPRQDRKVAGEERFLEQLQSRLASYNTARFGSATDDYVQLHIHKGGLSVREQMRMFRSARVVLSPHGAGLANTLFCQPRTTVFEFPPQDQQLRYFEYISMAMELDHILLPNITSMFYGKYELVEPILVRGVLDSIFAILYSDSS
jgi:hypothetical protein